MNQKEQKDEVHVITDKELVFGLMVVVTIGSIIFGVYSFSKVEEQSAKGTLNTNSVSSPVETSNSFYTNATANVRKCASLTCEKIAFYPVNTEFQLDYASIEEMPEWIEVSIDTGGTGFLNKVTLSKDKASGTFTNNVGGGAKSLPEIVKEWSGHVGFLTCYKYDYYGQLIPVQTASAYLHRFKDGYVRAVTNKHAVVDESGVPLSRCTIEIAGKYYEPINSAFVLHPGFDIAQSSLYESTYLESLERKPVCYRNSTIELGDEVAILGYPGIGSGRTLTVTEGIVSGVDYPYYTTSAKIDHGNSGGVAILIKDDCFLGIPTGSVVGEIESLGRILDISTFSTQ